MKNLFVVFGILIMSIVASAAQKDVKTIHWVLAHQPVDLFREAAEHFSKEITQKTNGRVVVEILTLPEYSRKYKKGAVVGQDDVIKMVRTGEIEMSQTYTTDLGAYEKDMYVLDMPFLFRDHEHAKKVLEGPVGEQLLAGLAQNNIRGLAFTYSGGYRITPSEKPIRKIEDFKGVKIRTSGSPVAQDTFQTLGATPVVMSLDDVAVATRKGQISASESTFARYFPLRQVEHSKVVNDTEHSLFLTTIMVNETFWKTLPADVQTQMRQVALESARLERQHSIVAAIETKKKCQAAGIEIVEWNKAETDRFKAAMKPVYVKYAKYFSPGMVESIQKQE